MDIRNFDLCYLDKIRIYKGYVTLKNFFYDLCKMRKETAIKLINDERLLFPTLFTLLPEINEYLNIDNLNQRNKTALNICSKILKTENEQGFTISKDDEYLPFVLKWMFDTGIGADGLNDDYDEIIDSISSLLINTYKINSILPKIAELIFKRYKNERNIHDLVWVFFKAHDPESIKLIARYLKSNDSDEVNLACKLLNHNPEGSLVTSVDRRREYSSYITYLENNMPYIFFTDENMFYSSEPRFFNIDLKEKYKSSESNNQ